ASSKTYNKVGVFVTNPKDINNIEENINILKDWEFFGITHDSFQNYVSKTIEWYEKADTKLKSTFYTEERYNELKNQLRSLQNAKNKLAKSQPHEDIRNTEYMSCCIRGWLKDFFEHEYYREWAIRMINYQIKMDQYDGDEMENSILSEQLEIWDT
ncbi:26387_t:CDS:2, partial [Gigaspora margarita]